MEHGNAGTFNVVPSILRQLFAVHEKIENQTVPLTFCLMTEKNKESYFEFFYELHRIAVDSNNERTIF